MSAALRTILGALECGEIERALALLVDAELQAFNAGQRLAGDIAYVRWRLAGGDVLGATARLRRLVGGGA